VLSIVIESVVIVILTVWTALVALAVTRTR
jgi:hypothetical protein